MDAPSPEHLPHSPSTAHRPSRRRFLATGATALAGLMVGFPLTSAAARLVAGPPGTAAAGHKLGAWVRIGSDDVVTIVVSQAEIGQGISTTLPALLADELGADWSRVRLETAPYDRAYRNPRANWMFTGNSESAQAFHDLMRRTGAAAREMLTSVAATQWGVPPAECRASAGEVTHAASGRRARFGELAAQAAQLPVPQAPSLRPEAELTLYGRSVMRVDVPEKVDGSAVFGIDFTLPGLLHAAVRTAPTLGGTLREVDEAFLRAQPGVRTVVRLPDAVAVVADTWWQARRALSGAKLSFDPGPNAGVSSARMMADYRSRLAKGPFVTAVSEGDADGLLAAGPRRHAATYENPFLAHATLEPMNCTARVSAERCEIWAPTQGQELAFFALKGALGLKDEQIAVHRTPYAGGGFGRRLLPDFVVQAALIARAAGAPVRTLWDREEDMRRAYYRPATLVQMSAPLGRDGLPLALAAKVVSPTILLPVFPPIAKTLAEKRFDPSALEGMLHSHYPIKDRKVEFHLMQVPVPTSVLRTTGYGPNVFAIEGFIDELARLARMDPYAYRRKLLATDARALAVLERAAQLSGWGKPLPRGSGRGLAYAHAFGTRIAQVVEVAVRAGKVKVRKVTSVADCGKVLDPGIAAAGIEGGVVFGLSGCKSEITFKDGAPEQPNLAQYAPLTLAESPDQAVEFIEGGGALGGVGEVGPVAVVPALANAIHAATGRRLRSMPLSRHGLAFA